MGGRSSKKSFNEWDLIGFSDVTGEYSKIVFVVVHKKVLSINWGVPLEMVEKIYKDFSSVTGNDDTIDKTEFRRLFKKMYIDSQPSSLPSALPPFFSTHELNKMADHVFETYDYEETGMNFIIFH